MANGVGGSVRRRRRPKREESVMLVICPVDRNDATPAQGTCSPVPNPLTSKLKEIRSRAGLTQKGLAQSLGIGQTMISMIETGQSQTTIDILEKWVEACGASIDIRRNEGDPHVDEIVETAERLSEQDRYRLVRLAQCLERAEGATRQMMIGQMDALANSMLSITSMPPLDNTHTPSKPPKTRKKETDRLAAIARDAANLSGRTTID